MLSPGHWSILVRFNIITPALLKAPEFYKTTKFRDPDSMTESPFQLAHNTDRPAFEWTHEHRPDMIPEFGLWMPALRGSRT